MNICVFDTETVSINKPFCYNVGLVIYDTDSRQILHKADYVIDQIWHNLPLFNTAYYADKRPVYVGRMRGKKTVLKKWGHVMQDMIRVFKTYEVQAAFAYNSPFDDKVFSFNCDWFKTKNPFDNVPIYDIRGYVHKFIAFTPSFKDFCETNKAFTESGNYSTTAETLFQYITQDSDFQEEHTALSDSLIELEILTYCVDIGAEWGKEYKVYNSIPRKQRKFLMLKDTIHNQTFSFQYEKISINKDKTLITLK